MKILVISDSHGKFENIYNICEFEKPDVIFFSGDGVKDIKDIEILFPTIKFFVVRGNCDFFDYEIDYDKIIELEGMKFFLTHGHFYEVKKSYERIKEKGFTENIDVLIFGHTHFQECVEIKKESEKLIIFNSGTIFDGFYGVIELKKNKKIKFIHKKFA